ncbi:MAG: hypothetical protein ACJKSS_00545 [Patescibacteria group bacterium UBA2103]
MLFLALLATIVLQEAPAETFAQEIERRTEEACYVREDRLMICHMWTGLTREDGVSGYFVRVDLDAECVEIRYADGTSPCAPLPEQFTLFTSPRTVEEIRSARAE